MCYSFRVCFWYSILSLLFTRAASPQEMQWRLAAGSEGLRVTALDIYRSNPDTMYAISDSGLLISTNMGELWNKVPGGRSISSSILNAIRVDPFDSRRLYASHDFGHGGSNAFSKSTDGGANWEMIVPDGGSGFGAVIKIDPTNHHIVYAVTGYGFLQSTDRGASWLSLPVPFFSIQSLDVNPQNGGNIFISYNTRYYHSVDTGATWTDISFGWEVYPFTRVFIHPDGPIYVTSWSGPSSPGGVFRSTDGGKSWGEMNNGLDPGARRVSWITANPLQPNEMFLCTGSTNPSPQATVFFSPDSGHVWLPLTAGLPRGYKDELVIEPIHRRVLTVVSTNQSDSNGIYVLDLETKVEEDTTTIPEEFKVLQNYPNPFNPTTRIRFSVPNRGRVRLEVFNPLGQRVRHVFDGLLEPGEHEVEFDGDGLPSGMYFYKLIADRSSLVGKMILIR
jgi:photosystem II stability/assembly factor-like uncharacterized protein